MRKKIALALASLLMLTALLTTPYLTLPATSTPSPSPKGVYHWKIELAQKKANARIVGYLTDHGVPIPGTEFDLWCNCTGPVFTKVNTTVVPTDIEFVKYIDWNKDGIWDVYEEYVSGDLVEEKKCHKWYQHEQKLELNLQSTGPWTPDDPICSEWEDPLTATVYHLSSWEDTGYPYGEISYSDQVDLTPITPPGPKDWWHVRDVTPTNLVLDKLVVVEVHEQPYDPDFPWFEWQLKIKQHNANVLWKGNLTRDGYYIPGTDFSIVCNCTTLQVVVVRTPYSLVPNDIDFTIKIYSKDDPGMLSPIDVQHHKKIITQFPWNKTKKGTDPLTGDKWTVELELTEVQMHLYWTMGGWTTTAGYLGPNPVWNTTGWKVGDGVPFATRAPWLTPYLDTMYITFEQKDPITGIVKIKVPAESYKGLDHMWYSFDVGTWFRSTIILEEAGCGWIFTGDGKEPVYGSVDTLTYNNWTGVYTYGPDQIPKTADDELLAGLVPGAGPAGEPGSAGAGSPIGPCLQELRGPDGILGTGDDPIGRGDPDGPNGNGSSLLFLPATNIVRWWDDSVPKWKILYTSPWPQLYTTGTANDTIIEPQTKPKLRGATAEATGEPWEFLAGEDHKDEGYKVHWKHEKCNAYATYANAWSVLYTDTELGQNDVLFVTRQKIVRDDCVIGDVDCNELVDIMDILIAGMSFGGEDEYVGPDGIPMTPDDKRWATAGYDARGDISDDRGLIDIMDILVMAMDFGGQLTPACIVYPW